MCFAAGWNGFAGWIWPAGRSLENLDLDYEEEWWQHTPLSDSNINAERLRLTPSTQSFWAGIQLLDCQQEAPINTILPQHPPKLFTRNPVVYFLKIDKTCAVYKSLVCSQDFSKICWRVEISSVMLRQRQKPHWVSSSFGSIIFPSWHALVLGGLAKSCHGSWFVHSCLTFCVRER